MDRNDAQRQVKSLCAANRLRGTFSQLSTVEKITLHLFCMLIHVCHVMVQAHSLSIV